MATLAQVGEVVTSKLRERVDGLAAALEEDVPDFGTIANLADAVGELADRVAGIYTELEQTLMRGLQSHTESGQESDDQRRGQEKSRREQRHQQSDANGSGVEDVTKEELLERARHVNVHGRSSMSKDELAEAVEAEETQTKDELLERAREAEIEGRASMTKEELREALTDADA